MQVLIGVVLLAGAGGLRYWQVGPVPTWFYVFAWYPVLIILDGLARKPSGASWLLRARAVSLLGWSAIVWLVYEVANFRLQNWYYINLPRSLPERWSGVLISFATVLPAVFFTERLLRRHGVGERWRTSPLNPRPWEWRAIPILGTAMVGAAIVWPRYLSPLIWGAGLLIFDPVVYRRRPEQSLLGGLARGSPGLMGRLLMSGLAIGLLWEGLNAAAGAGWIYTVPFLEDLKLFEMPPLGFIGFPIFALSAYSAYQALAAAGVAVDPEASVPPPVRPFRTLVSGTVAAIAAFATLAQMDYRTVSSTVAVLDDVPGLDAIDQARLTREGIVRPRDLLNDSNRGLADRLGVTDTTLHRVQQTVELMMLRGIGAAHANQLAQAGIHSVCRLAAEDPAVVWRDIHALFRDLGPRPTKAEVRVWHRAATNDCRGRCVRCESS